MWPHLPSSQIPTPLPIGAVHVQVQGWCETSPNSPFFQIWVPAAGWQWMRYGNPRTTRLLGRHWDEVSSLYRPSPGAACGPDPPLPQAGPPLVSFTPQPNCPLPNWEAAQRCVRVLWVWASRRLCCGHVCKLWAIFGNCDAPLCSNVQRFDLIPE